MQESAYLERRSDFIDRLRGLPLFDAFSDDMLLEILSLSKLRKYAEGETIIEEGVYDTWVYIILSGAVRILKGDKVIATLRRSGDVFGEMGVIDGSPRSATITAAVPSMCLAIDASVIERMSGNDKDKFNALMYRLFADLMASRLRSTSDELAKTKSELHQARKELAELKAKRRFV